jgi:hypothetical protein
LHRSPDIVNRTTAHCRARSAPHRLQCGTDGPKSQDDDSPSLTDLQRYQITLLYGQPGAPVHLDTVIMTDDYLSNIA